MVIGQIRSYSISEARYCVVFFWWCNKLVVFHGALRLLTKRAEAVSSLSAVCCCSVLRRAGFGIS